MPIVVATDRQIPPPDQEGILRAQVCGPIRRVRQFVPAQIRHEAATAIRRFGQTVIGEAIQGVERKEGLERRIEGPVPLRSRTQPLQGVHGHFIPAVRLDDRLHMFCRGDTVRRHLDPGAQNRPVGVALGAVHHIDRTLAIAYARIQIADVGVDTEPVGHVEDALQLHAPDLRVKVLVQRDAIDDL